MAGDESCESFDFRAWNQAFLEGSRTFLHAQVESPHTYSIVLQRAESNSSSGVAPTIRFCDWLSCNIYSIDRNGSKNSNLRGNSRLQRGTSWLLLTGAINALVNPNTKWLWILQESSRCVTRPYVAWHSEKWASFFYREAWGLSVKGLKTPSSWWGSHPLAPGTTSSTQNSVSAAATHYDELGHYRVRRAKSNVIMCIWHD